MVGPLDWHKFLRNRLGIMLPFRYVTLRVRVFYLYLHNSSGIQWGFPDSLLWPVSLPSASPRDERFLARGEVSRPWATRAGGGLKGVWHWLFLPEPRKPLLDSYQIFPRVEKCASCSSNNKDLLVSWVFESPSTASEPFDNCTSYLCIKSLILTFVIQLELITLNVEKISHRRL